MHPSFLHRIRWSNVALVTALVAAGAALVTWPSTEPPPAEPPPSQAGVPYDAGGIETPAGATPEPRARAGRRGRGRAPVVLPRGRRRERSAAGGRGGRGGREGAPHRRPTPVTPAASPIPAVAPAAPVGPVAPPPPAEFGFER